MFDGAAQALLFCPGDNMQLCFPVTMNEATAPAPAAAPKGYHLLLTETLIAK
jgi:hypothetical protein